MDTGLAGRGDSQQTVEEWRAREMIERGGPGLVTGATEREPSARHDLMQGEVRGCAESSGRMVRLGSLYWEEEEKERKKSI
jgi:hypothetical protein